jgi:HK97 family phage prohead protease
MKHIAVGRACTFSLLNRNDDLVLESAIESAEMESFARGGLVYHEHREEYDAIIGNVTKAWNDSHGLMVRIEFNDRPQGKRAAQKVEAALKAGIYPGLSLRYAIDMKELTPYGGTILRAVRLLELSLTDTPADFHACIHEFRQELEKADMDKRDRENSLKFKRALEANIRKFATTSDPDYEKKKLWPSGMQTLDCRSPLVRVR